MRSLVSLNLYSFTSPFKLFSSTSSTLFCCLRFPTSVIALVFSVFSLSSSTLEAFKSSSISIICVLRDVSLAADSESNISSCSIPVLVETCKYIYIYTTKHMGPYIYFSLISADKNFQHFLLQNVPS